MFARVYIQRRTRSLERPFDYLIPRAMDGSLKQGSVVLVPFGRQKALGIVENVVAKTDVPKGNLLKIERVLEYPPIPEILIQLALWVSHYYYSSPAAAMSLVMPPGGLPSLRREILDGKKIFTLKAPRIKPRQINFVRITDGSAVYVKDKSLQRGPLTGAFPFRLTAARRRVLELLGERGELPLAEVLKQTKTGRSTIKLLAALGVLEIVSREVHREGLRYYGDITAEQKRPQLNLNKAQRQAVRAITAQLDQTEPSRRSRPILIEGVAGAGKTEVYLCAIEAAIARGGRAIVLVPEISLTHQAVRRFRRRFGRRVGVLHSGLSLGERYDEYMRIRKGEVDVVIGPRSALFAPLADLSLIIVDEENDSSFKQESEPRYDARRTAMERARLEGAVVVYGSATPSLESYHLIKNRFVIPERATGAPMPAVEIVDMRQESDQIFSRRLLDELDVNLAAGAKAILMLNSRGYARFLQCAHSGYVWKCKNCDVSLTIHSRIGRLLCHHCGYSRQMPDICPECGSSELRRWGVGTENLEFRAKQLFPEAPVFRLDADTASGYGAGPRIIQAFEKAERAILVGTQMVAKGHHFPEVTLAAVINADLALEFPEFRAEERTFTLLKQLAGRSGRAGLPGKVLIQTWNGDIECIRMAADQATEQFYRAELNRRRRLGYPPFVSLINVIFLSRQSGRSSEAAALLREELEPELNGEEKLLGPADLFRLKGWSRSHLLVKTTNAEGTLSVIKPVIEHHRKPFRSRGIRIVVDVDPQWLS